MQQGRADLDVEKAFERERERAKGDPAIVCGGGSSMLGALKQRV